MIFTVTAAGAPTGTVTITSGDEERTCTADVVVGRCTLTLWNVGKVELVATYNGDARFARSVGVLPYEVIP